MRRAFISDIHANKDALLAVLDDIDDRGIDDIVCLGDMVGYGPEPAECVALVRDRCRVTMMGNHDYALLTVPYGFNPIAAQAIKCNRSLLENGCLHHRRCDAHLDFLKNRPMKWEEGGLLYVHASPRDPLAEYVLSSDVEYGPTEKIRDIMKMLGQVQGGQGGTCFVGHSHRPGVVTHDLKWLRPEEAQGLDVSKDRFIVNEGSVGQPRDGDPRACYVELDDGKIYFHRVEYPFRKTMQKILDGGCLDSFCAERLAVGK